MRKVKVLVNQTLAGFLWEDESGYHFKYDSDYLNHPSASAISLLLPLQNETYDSELLFPFFDGLIPEGWLLDITQKSWKIDPRDRMGLLMVACRDCIGNVSIEVGQ
jgi:serine/threonine-protein kinase HipA